MSTVKLKEDAERFIQNVKRVQQVFDQLEKLGVVERNGDGDYEVTPAFLKSQVEKVDFPDSLDDFSKVVKDGKMVVK